MSLSPSEGLRLITIGDQGKDARVDLIHEALLRTPAAKEALAGRPVPARAQPYWPALAIYILQHKDRDLHRQNFAHATEARAQAGRLARWLSASSPFELMQWWPLRSGGCAHSTRQVCHGVFAWPR